MQPIRQRVTVDFAYDVHFTEHLFRPTHSLLAATIHQPDEPGPKKAVAVVDDGLIVHWPDLLEELGAYARAHDEVMMWAADPVVVPGGEAAKNDPALVNRIHRVIFEAHLDRHAYVRSTSATGRRTSWRNSPTTRCVTAKPLPSASRWTACTRTSTDCLTRRL